MVMYTLFLSQMKAMYVVNELMARVRVRVKGLGF